jgi:hypothetical protein
VAQVSSLTPASGSCSAYTGVCRARSCGSGDCRGCGCAGGWEVHEGRALSWEGFSGNERMSAELELVVLVWDNVRVYTCPDSHSVRGEGGAHTQPQDLGGWRERELMKMVSCGGGTLGSVSGALQVKVKVNINTVHSAGLHRLWCAHEPFDLLAALQLELTPRTTAHHGTCDYHRVHHARSVCGCYPKRRGDSEPHDRTGTQLQPRPFLSPSAPHCSLDVAYLDMVLALSLLYHHAPPACGYLNTSAIDLRFGCWWPVSD